MEVISLITSSFNRIGTFYHRVAAFFQEINRNGLIELGREVFTNISFIEHLRLQNGV